MHPVFCDPAHEVGEKKIVIIDSDGSDAGTARNLKQKTSSIMKEGGSRGKEKDEIQNGTFVKIRDYHPDCGANGTDKAKVCYD